MQRRSAAGLRSALLLLGFALLVPLAPGLQAQQMNLEDAPDEIVLTHERIVDLYMNNSYRVRYLNMDIEQTRLRLKSSRARLKSRVDLDFTVPAIDYVSETRWDSDLQRNVIQRENSRRMEAELSVRQPVILFGYPTNGYLSLNSRMYQLRQVDEGDADVRYYNRYYVRYTQPLFEANELKNDLEEAELDLESQELDFYGDVVEIIDESADDYFELFEIAYQQRIREDYVARLDQALSLAQAAAAANPDRSIDVDQVQVELANAREDLTSNESRYRWETSSLKTEFGIPQATDIVIDPQIELARVPIDGERATQYALELTPRMRNLEINLRESEIRLDNQKGRGGFDLDVSLSYGREMQDEIFSEIWGQPENSYTVDVRGSVPLWDWGQRDAEIRQSEIGLEQSRLRMEETQENIEADIQNGVRNVAEYEDRAFNMEENLERSRSLAEQSLTQYESGTISAQDLLQNLGREQETAENFLDAYIGWKEALQRIQRMTYYDWERDTRLMDRFGISFEEGLRGASMTANGDGTQGGS